MKIFANVTARAWAVLFLGGLAGMLFYIDRQTLSVLKTTLRDEMGWTDTHYSWLVAAFMVPYTACYFVTGRLIDRHGTRVMMPVFIGAMSLATLLSGFAQNLGQMAACRFLLGMAEAGIVPAVLVAIVAWFPKDRRGTATTINKPLTIAGQIIATPMCVWITHHWGWRWSFFIPGVIGLLAAKLWWMADQRNLGASEPTTENEPAPGYGEVLRNRALWGLVLARILSDPLWFFMLYWQPAYLQEKLGMSLTKVGQVGWIPTAVALGVSMSLGVLSDWLIQRGMAPATSRIRILQGLACLSPSVLVLPWITDHALAIALLCLAQIMMSVWLGLSNLLMTDLVPRRMVGTAVAIMSAFGAGTGALFNLVAGPLIENLGYTTIFVAGALLHPLAAVLLWWCYDRKSAASAV